MRVLRVRGATPSLQVGAEGGWIALNALGPGGGREDASTFGPRSVLFAPLRISLERGGWSIADGLGFRPTVAAAEEIELRPVMGDRGSPLVVDGRAYPGSLRLVAADSDRAGPFDVVNHVALEEYLPGVLARELFSHWRPDAFAAQAIAARSFACSERSYRASRRWDVTSTTSSQVYAGLVDHERGSEAARRTRGMVLAWSGALVPGYYSSCCGGLAADARDVISPQPYNDVPPLHGRSGRDVCGDASLYSWSITRKAADVTRRINAFGEQNDLPDLARLPRVEAIEVSARNRHGRPSRYVARGGGEQTAPIAAETLRRAVDYAGSGLEPPERRLFSSYVAVTSSGAALRFDGHGHGHGAGLCQYGAEALARDGTSFRSILEWYYPGVEIVPAYT